MSNKEKYNQIEVIEKQNNHLNRTLQELGWIKIKQSEYKLLKINDPKHFHNYTIRIRHTYFKQRNDLKINVYIDLTKSKFKNNPNENQELNHVIEVFKEKLRIVEWEINSLNN